MFVNRYKINLGTLPSGATETYLTIPISLESQEIGQSELIDKVFVDVQVENAINPIVDYDKVRFTPLNTSNNPINHIMFNLSFSGLPATSYADIGFSNDDIKFEKSNFTQSFLYMAFFDSDNPLTQKLVTYTTIFSGLLAKDLLPDYATQLALYGNTIVGIPGQPKLAHDIPLNFSIFNPIHNPRDLSEGYYLYDYRDELKIGESKPLYMRASFKNAKTGKSTDLMVKSNAMPIEDLIKNLYTKVILSRTSSGYYYKFDETYHGDGVIGGNNVTHLNNDTMIKLYQINAL